MRSGSWPHPGQSERSDERPAIRHPVCLRASAHVLREGWKSLHIVRAGPVTQRVPPWPPSLGRGACAPASCVLECTALGPGCRDPSSRWSVRVCPTSDAPLFSFDGLRLLALFVGHSVHLLVHQPYKVPDAALGQDYRPNLTGHHLLETSCAEPRRPAGPLPRFLFDWQT